MTVLEKRVIIHPMKRIEQVRLAQIPLRYSDGNIFSVDSIPHAGLRTRIRQEIDTLASAREEFLKLPSDDAGLDMDRIHAFRERWDLRDVPIRVLTEDTRPEAQSILNVDLNDLGCYDSYHDVIVVNRDKELEELNGGPQITESFIVHESAHGDAPPKLLVYDSTRSRWRRKPAYDRAEPYLVHQNYISPREIGDGRCGYLEEGFAEMVRAAYVHHSLGRHEGFSRADFGDNRFPLEVYSYKPNSEEPFTLPDGAIPAMTLSLLAGVEETFYGTLCRGRKEPTGRIMVEGAIDTILPGLSKVMQNTDITDPNKSMGLHLEVERQLGLKQT